MSRVASAKACEVWKSSISKCRPAATRSMPSRNILLMSGSNIGVIHTVGVQRVDILRIHRRLDAELADAGNLTGIFARLGFTIDTYADQLHVRMPHRCFDRVLADGARGPDDDLVGGLRLLHR